jgi:hypothetical protein
MSNEVPDFKNEDVKEKLEGTFSSYRPTYRVKHTLTMLQRKSSRSTWYNFIGISYSSAQTNLGAQSEDMQQEAIEVGTCLLLIGATRPEQVLIQQQLKMQWRNTQLRRFVYQP